MARRSTRCRKPTRRADESDARTASKIGVLPKQAYVVLRAYFTQVTPNPDKAQLAELIEKIHCIPGCEGCRTTKLQAYFRERRKKESRVRVSSGDSERTGSKPKAKIRNRPAETVEAESALPFDSPLSSIPSDSESEPETPSSRLENMHLHPSSPSQGSDIPRTFEALAKWLEEQNKLWAETAMP